MKQTIHLLLTLVCLWAFCLAIRGKLMQPSATLPLALGPTDGDITNTITVLSLPSGQATYVLATFNGTAAGIVEFDPMGTPARISYFPAPAASFPTQSAKSLAVGYGVLS